MPALAHQIARVDWLSHALYAAELGEPFDFERTPTLPDELFAAVPELRVNVPYAAIRLLARLSADERADVRAGVARSLPWFVELYPTVVEQQLLLLACDGSAKVRSAAAAALADLLESTEGPAAILARWQDHPDRARQVLARALSLLPTPLRTR